MRNNVKTNDHQNTISLLLILLFITPFTEKSLAYASSITGRISRRPDPLRKFRHYDGDYDISSKHYWASTAFTGIHGYAVAGIWLLCGLGLVLFIVIKSIKRSPSTIMDHSSSSNLIVLLLLLVITSFAIVASGLTIAENQKTLKKAQKLEETIRDAGNEASNSIGRVKAAMLRMQALLQPYNSDICNQLNLTTHRLRKTSLSIQSFIRNNLKTWDQAIQTLYVMNLVVVSVDLVLLVAGLVLLRFQFRPGINVLIFTCWILTTLGWILTGVDFLFHTFIGDTCLVLKNYEIDPQTNSLGNMLPCPKSTDSVQTLEKIIDNIHAFINEINWKIREVIESNEQYEGIPVVEVCDPFSTSINDSFSLQSCAENSIPIGDLPRVLSIFVCYEANNTSGNCQEEGRFLPESMYTVSLAYSQSMQDFINIYPDLSSLMKCTSIKEAFSEIVTRQCRPIELSTRGLWASMLALSVVMVVLVLLWIYRTNQGNGLCLCW
ncbi:ATP-dependent caseinolytic (Clp)protease/crotonase family protein [Striga asiatica]|uniref:ATP-dependent caseinolytic (Clp)protease/crotonase family protein n=1 Tax=Striga asiatica TaxID=4170 RepID=A0A5A7PDZ0_STRAF|nr:ATP-dependent caseinolytic (Clp)protease/crotonase family protein [Striga asiatica]